MKLFDVTSIGSTMVKFSVPAGKRLETEPFFDVSIGGTESNTMIALSRLGRCTAWVSRLRGNALGRRVRNDIRAHGVDVSRKLWAEEGRNEIYFVEYAAPPRPIQVLYDRENAPIAKVALSDIDIPFLLNTKIVHFTGILAALSENCRQVIDYIMGEAQKLGVTVSFDVNYREKLWPAAVARKHLEPLLNRSDIIVMTLVDAKRIFGIFGEGEEVLETLNKRYDAKTFALTMGEAGALARSGEGLFRSEGYQVSVIDRLGAGDSFCAGLLHGVLDGDIRKGLDYGTAMAALNLGITGDLFIAGEEEILQLVNRRSGGDVSR